MYNGIFRFKLNYETKLRVCVAEANVKAGMLEHSHHQPTSNFKFNFLLTLAPPSILITVQYRDYFHCTAFLPTVITVYDNGQCEEAAFNLTRTVPKSLL
jgi:hypothetical protein